MQVRLQKYLADAGVASRRKSEELIKKGLISVNGKIVSELGTKVNGNKDVVMFEGNVVSPQIGMVYYILNKPTGYITSVTDDRNRKTIMDLLNVKERVFPVGRLDANSSGLLIVTNDGDLTYRLTHPKHHISKTYRVLVKGIPSERGLELLREGTKLEEYTTSPCNIKVIDKNEKATLVEVVLYEGKKRQIRKMFEHIGCPVIKLDRIKIGKISKGSLKIGLYRELTVEEIKYLKQL